MQMPLLIIWLEMEMTCSQPIVLEMSIGVIKIHREVALFGLKVLHTKIGRLLDKDQEWKLHLFLMVLTISTVQDH